MTVPELLDHDLFCECTSCKIYWFWESEQEEKDDYLCNEINEEQERELDQIHGLDGF